MLSIYCCCGSGLGTSLILKMSVEEALSDLKINNYDLTFGTSSSIPYVTDLVLCSKELAPNLSSSARVEGVRDLMNTEEIKSIIQNFIQERYHALAG